MRSSFFRIGIFFYWILWPFVNFGISSKLDEQFIKVCRGTNHKRIVTSLSPLDEAAYKDLKNKFSQCTHVVGNLELANIPDENTDLSFLQNIRQVTGYINIENVRVPNLNLSSLEVIHGKDLVRIDNKLKGLALVINSTNFKLKLPRLKAILDGGFPENYKLIQNFTCSINCNGGCFGPDTDQCCHAYCAGGCTGPSNSECIACKHALMNGVCEEKCPVSLYSAQGICVKTCPANLFRDDDLMECVFQCSNDKDEKDNACIPCTPPSCKICSGATKPDDYVNIENIETFRDCTILLGSLRLNQHTFKQHVSDRRKYDPRPLDLLNSIRKVRGSVEIDSVQNPEITSLGFLKNLKEIEDGLSITWNNIAELGLSSLKRVTGGIEILNNSKLCFVAGINWRKVSGDRAVIKVEGNADPYHCEFHGNVCSDSCLGKDGCWAWGGWNCVTCKKYRLNGKCQEYCINAIGKFEDAITGSCVRCHANCYDCVGPGPGNCTSCASNKFLSKASCEGKDKCPEKYGWGRTCLDCHANCSDGCTGPGYLDCLALDPITESTPKPTTSLPAPNSSLQMTTSFSPTGAPEPTYHMEIGAVSLATIVWLILGILCCYVLKRIRSGKAEEIEMRPCPSSTVPHSHVRTMNKIDRGELSHGEELGRGYFGVVFEGIWTPIVGSSQPVAIKMLQGTKAEEFLHEASIMFKLDHPNILGFCGICEEPSLQLVTPLLPLGSLLNYVINERGNIEANIMLLWCTQIASGMEYLESKLIVHRDLSSRNVLMATPTIVKITDFGLARLLDRNNPQYRARYFNAPFAWLAIESILGNIYTHKSDVWQFGVTVWELLMFGERPFRRNGRNMLLGNFLGDEEIRNFLLAGNRLEQPEICKDELYAKLLETWRYDPEDRPSFTELVREFGEMTNNPNNFIDMERERRNAQVVEAQAMELERAADVEVENYLVLIR